MIYKHPQFVLNTESKKVVDENGKKLRITGNAYRMLVFLCEKKNATLTDIGTYLDWAKEYTENHIRQYRYKINNTIGADVIEYENGVYSLCNTDLLQGNMIELEKSNKNVMEKENIKFTIVPGLIASAMLFLALLEFPYGYYTLLRIAITIISVYYIYWIYTVIKKQDFWFWGLIITTILFNPIIPIYLGNKSIWVIIDIITALFFISLIIRYKKHKNMDINIKNKGFISLFVIAIISLIAVSIVTTGVILYKKGISKSTASISESITKEPELVENTEITEITEIEEIEPVTNSEELNKIEQEAEKTREKAERLRQEAEKIKKEQEQLEAEQETKRLEEEAKKIAEQNKIKEQKEKEDQEKLLLEQGKQLIEQMERERQQKIAEDYRIEYEKRNEERRLAENLEKNKKVIEQITTLFSNVSDELDVAYDKVQEQGKKIEDFENSVKGKDVTTSYFNLAMNEKKSIYNNLVNKYNSLLEVKNKISTILFEVKDYYEYGTIVPASSRSYLSSLGVYL